MEIEICTNSYRSAKIAAAAGVDRVELCQSLELGGLTPSAGDINLTLQLKAKFDFKVFVLIRPRPGDFCFSKEEFEVMREDVLYCKAKGVDGVVLGALASDASIDVAGIQSLVDAAGQMELTFHRAFDALENPFDGLEQLIALGFDRVLTSGQEQTAFAGRALLKALIEAADNRIQVMPGSGINGRNVRALIEETKARAIHFSAKKTIKSSFTKGGQSTLNKAGITESNFWLTGKEQLEEILAIVRS